MSMNDIKARDINGKSASDLAEVSDEAYHTSRRQCVKTTDSVPELIRKFRQTGWLVFCQCDEFSPLHEMIEAGLSMVKEDLSAEELENLLALTEELTPLEVLDR
jgi:hypothetical protein